MCEKLWRTEDKVWPGQIDLISVLHQSPQALANNNNNNNNNNNKTLSLPRTDTVGTSRRTSLHFPACDEILSSCTAKKI